jgi:hypothetical protein
VLHLLFSHHLSLNDRWEVTDSSFAKGCGTLQMVQQLRTSGPGRAHDPDGVKRGTRPTEPRRPVRRRASSSASMSPADVEVVDVRVRPEIHAAARNWWRAGAQGEIFSVSIQHGEGDLGPAGTNVWVCVGWVTK